MKSEELKVKSELRDSSRVEQVMVAVHDTIVETTTITVRENEQGDTVRISTVTERDRSRSRADVRSMKEEVRVVRDTVFVERRDSVEVKSEKGKVKSDGASALVSALKWVFWILVALTVLMVLWKVSKFFRL